MILASNDLASLSPLITGIPGPGLSMAFKAETAMVICLLAIVVDYLEFFERNLDSIPGNGSSSFRKKTGKPIFELNHQFGKEEIFDSGTNRGVAMRMLGYLVIKEEGLYQLQALSNDGVKVMLSGETVISDPEQHSDRLSNIGNVTIDKAGHYPLQVEYFQRKGTAALKLFWKTPGSENFVPIPANAYVHLP